MATLMMCPELFPDCDVDNLGIDLSFVGCAVGNVETSCSAVYGFDVRYHVVGTGGMIVVGSYLHMPLVIRRNRTGAITGMISKWDRFLPAYFVQLEHFVDCLQQGRTPLVTVQEVYEASCICVAATIAHLSVRTVELSEVH